MKTIDKYAVIESVKIFGLEEKASIKEIKKTYKKLMHKWHPDKCRENQEKCSEMTKRITDAYSIIIEYCENHLIDFSEEEISNDKIHFDQEKFWKEHFGNDTLW